VSAASRHAAAESFPKAARHAVADEQLRTNVRLAQTTIRAKRASVVDELEDWEELRDAGAAVKQDALERLDEVLVALEASVRHAGGEVHWARDAEEANAIVVDLVGNTGAREVVKVKSLLTDEIGLNDALAAAGIAALETDLAELICQLADERPSHLLVPAIHKNRHEIGDLFRERLDRPGLSDEPGELADAARAHLRAAFLRAKVGISGANFAVAETGTVCVVESEGNGRMCTSLPETLITVMGIEKAIPAWQDLEVFLQLLPRSATGERMNPYTSLWTGVFPGDGPQEFHLVLVDAGRTRALADPVGRDALRCIRCAACIHVCPVYRQVGGHAYHSVYAGPIGAILQPQLSGERGQPGSLPFASSLCGACADVCPVRIDIPRLLVHERERALAAERPPRERSSLRALGRIFSSRRRYERAQRVARDVQGVVVRDGWFAHFPGPLAGWGSSRDLPGVGETFREWWSREHRP
jgi:L-lactate dehydrogenase complex protein LldF